MVDPGSPPHCHQARAKAIQPAHIIAWSLWRRAHQAVAQRPPTSKQNGNCNVRRFRHVSNSDGVFGTHTAFRRPPIDSFMFAVPPRPIHADIVKAGSTSSRRAAASRASASRPRWAEAGASVSPFRGPAARDDKPSATEHLAFARHHLADAPVSSIPSLTARSTSQRRIFMHTLHNRRKGRAHGPGPSG